jgi:hypothetical protein
MSISAAGAATEDAACPVESAEPPGRRTDLIQRTPIRVALISSLVLVPCFWQARIQAVDLSSHLYNAWLSILIDEGKAPGLAIAPQRTNVLFDLVLTGLMRAVGPWAAEHIAVSLAVLVFVWGAFTMICAISRRRPWYVLPFIAILAYGWTFHMGFMNFYLSLGLCCFAFSLLWKEQWKAAICALPLVALALVAHAIPVAWLAGAMAYVWLARRHPAHPAVCRRGIAGGDATIPDVSFRHALGTQPVHQHDRRRSDMDFSVQILSTRVHIAGDLVLAVTALGETQRR